jgi:4-hydroxy 2-oxovalerate aldolase
MIKLLDCTLRDGGYITNWFFGRENIIRIAEDLTKANFDLIEVGYLNKDVNDKDKSIFQTIEAASEVIPGDRKKAEFLAMADVDQFLPENVMDYKPGYIDGIRVVFYKHQIEKAMKMCKRVAEAGYKLFVQPMVTIDYTEIEYARLIDDIVELKPSGVSIVDSFGYMNRSELKYYFDILDSRLEENCMIGFHSHNNMQLSVLNAESLFEYDTKRTIIVDASLYGMGRGAGNLNTELIANFYNQNVKHKYNLGIVISLISDIIYPIYQERSWGYSPYFFLTAYYHCHPNYATYLLGTYDVTINEFERFLQSIAPERRVKCRKDTTIQMYEEFIGKK